MRNAASGDSLSLRAGDYVFRKGEAGDLAYVIVTGRIEILAESDAGEQRLAMLGPQDYFGELALISEAPRTASARALEGCELSVLSRDYLERTLRQADPLHRHLLRMITRRMQLTISGAATPDEEDLDIGGFRDARLAHERLRLLTRIRAGMSDGSLQLHLQPIVRLADADQVGFEGLMRYHSAQQGDISPGEFIPAAEDSGLVLELGRWAAEETCRLLAELQGHRPGLFINLNVSPSQFHDHGLLETIQRSLERHQLDPRLLHVEITESMVMADLDSSLAFLNACRKLGIQIMLDDFGTGYSAMSYLHRIPAHGIKLDRSFILAAQGSQAARTVVAGIVRLAHELDLTTVAEGIETREQALWCRDVGIDMAQGYYYGEPRALVGT